MKFVQFSEFGDYPPGEIAPLEKIGTVEQRWTSKTTVRDSLQARMPLGAKGMLGKERAA